jgi:hypothetical protein
MHSGAAALAPDAAGLLRAHVIPARPTAGDHGQCLSSASSHGMTQAI